MGLSPEGVGDHRSEKIVAVAPAASGVVGRPAHMFLQRGKRMADDIDDGTGCVEGTISEDGHLVVRGGEWVETEFGQVERWRRQAPDLYEAFMRQTEELATLRAQVQP